MEYAISPLRFFSFPPFSHKFNRLVIRISTRVHRAAYSFHLTGAFSQPACYETIRSALKFNTFFEITMIKKTKKEENVR